MDVGENSDVMYALTTGNAVLFGVEAQSGKIYTKIEPNLQGPLYQKQEILQVTAYNTQPYTQVALHNSTTTVTVNIKDVNDNTPVFTMAMYRVSIPEDQTIGSSIAR